MRNGIVCRLRFLKTTTMVLCLGLVMAYGGSAHAAPQYALDCKSCHTMPPLDSATAKKNPFTGAVPGNHQTHAGTTASTCAKCHGDGVVSYDNSHRNKKIEFIDGLGYGRKPHDPAFMNATSIPPNPLSVCSTAACHSNGKAAYRVTPAWSSKTGANCDTCHDSKPSTNSHTKHISNTAGYNFTCDKCHTDHAAKSGASRFQHATSAGRNIDVHFSTAPNAGGTFASNQCSNLYCHSNGQTGVGRTTTVPVWGVADVTCTSCHGNATTAGTLSGKHASHVNNAAVLGTNFGCVVCHSSTVSNDTTISDVTVHVNGTVNVAGAKVGAVAAGTTCAASSCHWDGKSIQKPVTWTQTATLGCDGCHGTSASFGAPAYVSGAAGSVSANSHAKHATSVATCANCHSKTTTTGTAIIAGSQHTDGFINFTSGNGITFGKQANKTCSDISCHSGSGIVANVPAAQWGAALTCAGCHGDSATLNTLSHGKHLLHGLSCETCHSDTAAGSTAIKSAALHANGAINVVGGTITFAANTKTCATVCHKGATPVWGSSATAACGTCHSIATTFSVGFNTKPANQPLHEFHYSAANGPKVVAAVPNGCQICHSFVSETDPSHANGTVNMNSGFAATVGTACGTCHKQATTGWVKDAKVTCESCHSTVGGALSVIGGITAPNKTSAAVSGHNKTSIGQTCVSCHDSSSAHIDTTVGNNKRLLPALTGTANAECNTCHNNPSIIVNKPLMLNMKAHQTSGIGAACSDCHNAHGTSNIMMVNTTINGSPVASFQNNASFANGSGTGVCQVCHTNQAKTSHFNKTVATQTPHVDSTANCLDCHLHNPTSGGLAFTPNGGCDACHGYPPAPRNIVGLKFGAQNQWSSARFEDYSGGGGAHLVAGHIPATAKESDGWVNCTPCHSGGQANHARVLPLRGNVEKVTVKVDPQLRFSDEAFITYTGAKLVNGGANKTGSCFNVSCHMVTSKPWSTER